MERYRDDIVNFIVAKVQQTNSVWDYRVKKNKRTCETFKRRAGGVFHRNFPLVGVGGFALL